MTSMTWVNLKQHPTSHYLTILGIWTASCTVVSKLSGLRLVINKEWEDVITIVDAGFECTHIADPITTTIRALDRTIEPSKQTELSSKAMLFLDNITVARAGRAADSFCRFWDAGQAASNLGRVGHTFVEFLSWPPQVPDQGPGKMFLDRDVYMGVDSPSAEVIAAELDLVRNNVRQMVERLSCNDNHLSFVVATRHGFCKTKGQYKLSFRPFIQGMRIRYTDIPTVIRELGQQEFWDMSVYKAREQLLATINGCKGRIGGVMDARILQPENAGDDPLMYIVQHADPSWPFLDVPSDYRQNVGKPVSPAAGDTIMPATATATDAEFVQGLVSCLSVETANDRRKWIAIGVVLKSEGEGFFQDWLRFSRTAGKFRGEDDCAKTWAGLRSDKAAPSTGLGRGGTCGIGTLCYYARRDNEAMYLEVIGRQRASKSGLAGEDTCAKVRLQAKSKTRRPCASIVPVASCKRSFNATSRIGRAMQKM